MRLSLSSIIEFGLLPLPPFSKTSYNCTLVILTLEGDIFNFFDKTSQMQSLKSRFCAFLKYPPKLFIK